MNHLLGRARRGPRPVPGARTKRRFALRNSAKAGGALCMRDDAKRIAIVADTSVPNLASQMRVAFASMAWNTGSSSPGELEMTCSTSEVAVCCCSDSRSSLSSRVFSMAMTAWAAKFCDQLDLLVGERTHLLAVDDDRADQLVVLEHRHDQKRARSDQLASSSAASRLGSVSMSS